MSSVREFAARIARLERGVTALGTAPQLGHSSLDDESVNVYDEDGNQKARVGLQHDGTYTAAELDGPIPPVPGVPTVDGGQGSLTVSWDGGYTDDARAPLDFRLVEIYAAPAPFTERADATLLGHFSNEAGGELSVARPVGEWHVGLVTKAESGRRSAVSVLAVGTVTSMIDQAIFDDLENRLDGLGDDLGDLITTIIPGLKDTINEITGVTLPALDVELGQAKSDIIDAFGAASDAATDASNAQDTADAAAQSAAEAVGLISGMGSVLFQDEQPGTEDENDSTLWIDTTDGLNVSKRWDGTEWVVVRDPAIVDAVDKAIAAKQAADEAKHAADDALALAGTAEDNAQLAILAAAHAQSSADGVAKNLFSTSTPSGTAPYGSIWFKVNGSGQVVGQWQQTATGIGSTWTVRAVRSEVIANLDVGKLTAGTAAIGNLVAQKIAVAVATVIELHADQITAGTIDVERLNAVAIAAAVGTFLELRADQITASGAGFDVAVINQLFADMFVAHKITAQEADLGSFLADEGWVTDMRAGILTASSVPPDALKLGMDELLPDPMFERETQPVAAPFSYTGQYVQEGQARTLQVSGSGLAAADRFWLSDSKTATPGERYILRAKARTGQHSYGIALGLEVQDEAGVRIGDVIVPSRIDQAVIDPDPEDPDDPEDEDVEYPLNEYFMVDGIVVVPESGFRVRPWLGLQPGDTATTGDWFVSSVSWRDVPSTTDAEGWVSQLTPNGLQVLTPSGSNSVQLGNFDERGLTLYQDELLIDDDGEPVLGGDGEPLTSENPTVSLTDDGYVGAREVSAGESFTYRGEELEDLLAPSPRGEVAYGIQDVRARAVSTYSGTSAMMELMALSFDVEAGRNYSIQISPLEVYVPPGAYGRLAIRNTVGTATPRMDSNLLDQYTARIFGSGNSIFEYVGSTTYRATVDETVNLLVCFVVDGAKNYTATVHNSAYGGKCEVSVQDIGSRLTGGTGVNRTGKDEPSKPAPPAPPPSKKTYTKTYGYRWHKTWQQNGAAPGPAQDAAYQGRTPYYTAAGRYRSQVGVKSMTSDLSGATIKKVQVRIRMDHSHNSAGGTVEFYTHSNYNKPGSYGNTSGPVNHSKFKRGQTKWVTLPSSMHAGFKSGSRRGIAFFTATTSTNYYVQMAPGRVAIKVTYEK